MNYWDTALPDISLLIISFSNYFIEPIFKDQALPSEVGNKRSLTCHCSYSGSCDGAQCYSWRIANASSKVSYYSNRQHEISLTKIAYGDKECLRLFTLFLNQAQTMP